MGNQKVPGRLLICLFACFSLLRGVAAQDIAKAPESDSAVAEANYPLLYGIFAAQSVLYGASLYGLSKSWYKNPLTNFHLKDDSRHWLQIDKAGHLFTAWQISRYSSELYKLTGVSRRRSALYGALSGFIFQTPIELLDGFSPDYGFSVTDVAANLSGAVLFAGQMLAWDEIRIHPKFSFRSTPYSAVRPQLLGEHFAERLLKDYNGQTYWLSVNPGAFFKSSGWPEWLCISAGYGIHRMVAAETDKSAQLGYTPYRQFYISPDIDLTRIPSRHKFLRSLGFFLNIIKIPAPTLEIRNGKLKFHPLYF